jgi:alkaline phosphatase D
LLAGGATAATAGGITLFKASRTPFTLGVASGDPTADGVVLWTRLAPEPLAGGGMPSLPVLVRWRLALDPRMRDTVQHGVVVAWPAFAHAVHVEVTGLAPGRWYYYQFMTGGDESPVGRTRTLPERRARVDRFRFAFVSCQDWQNGLYSAYRNLAREDVDLVIHLGDYIYEYAADPTAPRAHDGPEPTTLSGYRNRYALYHSDPHLQAAHAAFPWLAVPDDHEVENNYAGDDSELHGDPAQFLERRAAAYRAYYEHMPLRARSLPAGPDISLYRGLTVGDLLQVSALDTRQYRSPEACGGGFQLYCPEAFSPSATMTGPEQEQWLLGRLDESGARWNVVAQQTMFAQYDFLGGPWRLFSMDQWDGYQEARRRITSFLAARRPSNPVVITGDIHSAWVHDIKTDFDDPASDTVATEFIGPSITSDFPAFLIDFVRAVLPENPHARFFDARFHGYTRCEVTPGQWKTDFRAVPTILDDTAEAFTLASFVVLDGQPGALAA